MMIWLHEVVHQIYFILAAVFALLLLRGLFKRKTRTNWVYDIIYAYTLIPFLLRALHIK
ncbi:MAG TPA: hypothetical protein VJ958_01960 [Atribacterota bacterium]|nr:hypothetical protein [Atribacterota bacterium]